mmetsp:Transcript_3217/g.7568  ORF Transcript_3217/g.7568 Transcript_3217/m.7568 type:complete len:209 (+) Transcript_3217:380-1006(+)
MVPPWSGAGSSLLACDSSKTSFLLEDDMGTTLKEIYPSFPHFYWRGCSQNLVQSSPVWSSAVRVVLTCQQMYNSELMEPLEVFNFCGSGRFTEIPISWLGVFLKVFEGLKPCVYRHTHMGAPFSGFVPLSYHVFILLLQKQQQPYKCRHSVCGQDGSEKLHRVICEFRTLAPHATAPKGLRRPYFRVGRATTVDCSTKPYFPTMTFPE